MRAGLMLALILALGAAHGAARAQGTAAPGDAPVAVGDDNRILVPSPILTLDWERLYEGSLWGQRVDADIAAASASLSAENARIAEELVAEEKALTDRRGGMEPAAFRAEADAFDQRVIGIRAAQDAKVRELSRRVDEERQTFIEAVFPLLDAVLEARGAVAILDQRAIIRGAAAIDVTRDIGQRADALLGAGPARPDTPKAPASPAAPAPEPAPAPQIAPEPMPDGN